MNKNKYLSMFIGVSFLLVLPLVMAGRDHGRSQTHEYIQGTEPDAQLPSKAEISTEPEAKRAQKVGPIRPRFVLDDDENFYARPWPANARRLNNGAPDLRHFPNPDNLGFVNEAIMMVRLQRHAFGPYSVISLGLDGDRRALENLAGLMKNMSGPTADPRRCKAVDSPVQLVEVDPRMPDYGQAQSCFARVLPAGDRLHSGAILQARPVPGLGLLPGGTYAFLLRRELLEAHHISVSRNPDFMSLLVGKLPRSVDNPQKLRRARRWISTLAPLRLSLHDLNLQAEQIALATVFSVEDPTTWLRGEVRRTLQKAPAEITALEYQRQSPDFYQLRGRIRLPMYQQDQPPHLFGGGLLRMRNGHLDDVVYQDVPFVITLPKSAKPAGGYPLYLYFHGTGGLANQAARRGKRTSPEAEAIVGTEIASLAAKEGFASACIAGPFSPDRIGWAALDGYSSYNFFHPRSMEANFVQMLIEKIFFLKALQSMRIPAGLLPVGSEKKSAPIQFDMGKLVMGGQSLGSYLGGMVTASTGLANGAILTGAGGSWIEFAFGPKNPVDLQALLEKIMLHKGEHLDRFHPFIDLFELSLGSVDNTLFARHIYREPEPGFSPPHMLVIEGQKDLQVPTILQRALVLALGIDMLGDDVCKNPQQRLDTVLDWSGQARVESPVQNNFKLKQGGARTAVVKRYAEDGILEGHYVAMQRDEARAQIRQFLHALARGESPTL